MVRVKQGFLMKSPRNQSGSGLKAFAAKPQKRWVVLKSDELQYFEDDKPGAVMKGAFPVTAETHAAQGAQNELTVMTGMDTLVLFQCEGNRRDMDSIQDIREWCNAIKAQTKKIAKEESAAGLTRGEAAEEDVDITDAELHNLDDDMVDEASPDEWTVRGFLMGSCVSILHEIANVLLVDKVEGCPEVEHFKSLDRSKIAQLLCGESKTPVHRIIAEIVCQGNERLKQARAATAVELNNKFHQEEGVISLRYGDLDTFYRGLEGQVGAPDPRLQAAMEREHCDSRDSKEAFETTNYCVRTTSFIEYHFVVKGQQAIDSGRIFLENAQLNAYPSEQIPISPERRRTPRPLSDFERTMTAVNRKLEQQREGRMIDQELIGARLYTGPVRAACCRLRMLGSLTAVPGSSTLPKCAEPGLVCLPD